MEQRDDEGTHDWRLAEIGRNLNPRNMYRISGRHNQCFLVSEFDGRARWRAMVDERPPDESRASLSAMAINMIPVAWVFVGLIVVGAIVYTVFRLATRQRRRD